MESGDGVICAVRQHQPYGFGLASGHVDRRHRSGDWQTEGSDAGRGKERAYCVKDGMVKMFSTGDWHALIVRPDAQWDC